MLRLIRLVIAFIVLKKAKIITATSSYLAEELRKFGVNKYIHVIPNFEPDWIFETAIVKNKDLSNPKIIMINNGFDDRKNVKTGIKAFQKFRLHYPSAELHLYGNKYDEGNLASTWANEKHLADHIKFMGYMNFKDLMLTLRNYTMLVHPSKEETFGNILTESMGLGVPVVGGKNSGAVAWVIGEKEEGGVLVDVNDDEEIKNGMLKLISDQATYDLYAERARIHAQENFSVNKVLNAYIALYEQTTAALKL